MNRRDIHIPVGELYDANYDERLIQARLDCQDLCHRFNQLFPSQAAERESLLGEILGKKGKGVVVVSPFYCDYGCNVEIGDRSGFYTAGHPLDIVRRNKGLEYARPITIGDNVWIGGNVAILPGVTIGEGAVIGAGSVVTKDIPPYALAYGNPCRVIRRINQEETNDD